ncbi:DUF1064 domain-containing protein [Bradyrhizobium sp. Arg816]|uniref:DUF1064 domain-containing protein n=1 Tax=Bradyrhizobium sp. Arg816 TaxID=2998491 RepID=UPI00249E6B90|nr:DUF1064 domain-containing protein [Bradyrhizobium sp. Arg816]MDI3563537.1 DUF1064 domain-containing protein [Bradyrhizobium sp. Arg816]
MDASTIDRPFGCPLDDPQQRSWRRFTDADAAALAGAYEAAANAGKLAELAKSMGRTKHFLCRKARDLGLTDKNRSKPSRLKGAVLWNAPGRPPHPRGAAGLTHSPETKRSLSVKSRKMWEKWAEEKIGQMSDASRNRQSDLTAARHASGLMPKRYSRSKSGYRSDLGAIFFRSAWEANYARYLNLMIKLGVVQSWEFEPETFWFEKIKRGVRSYLPDFKVYYTGDDVPTFIEVKGWMDAKSKTKIKRFKKYYPQHRIEIVGSVEYRTITAQWASSIPNWESTRVAAGSLA